MSTQQLRDLAEKYIDKQLQVIEATVTPEKREAMINSVMEIARPT